MNWEESPSSRAVLNEEMNVKDISLALALRGYSLLRWVRGECAWGRKHSSVPEVHSLREIKVFEILKNGLNPHEPPMTVTLFLRFLMISNSEQTYVNVTVSTFEEECVGIPLIMRF